MTRAELYKALAEKPRKFAIDPAFETGELTICETTREIWRRADSLPEPQRTEIQTLAGVAFDFGKRMNARLRELKALA